MLIVGAAFLIACAAFAAYMYLSIALDARRHSRDRDNEMRLRLGHGGEP